LPPKKAALGQQGKAVGCVPPTALLSSGELHHCSSTGSEARSRGGLGAGLSLCGKGNTPVGVVWVVFRPSVVFAKDRHPCIFLFLHDAHALPARGRPAFIFASSFLVITDRFVRGGAYIVTKKLPERDGPFDYQVKSANEPHERVV
jgi:hypothetical protein